MAAFDPAGPSERLRRLAILRDMQRKLAQGPTQALGVLPGASSAQVRAAFMELTKLYHPAKYSRLDDATVRLANEVFLSLREAYESLRGPTQRRAATEGDGRADARVHERGAAGARPGPEPRADARFALDGREPRAGDAVERSSASPRRPGSLGDDGARRSIVDDPARRAAADDDASRARGAERPRAGAELARPHRAVETPGAARAATAGDERDERWAREPRRDLVEHGDRRDVVGPRGSAPAPAARAAIAPGAAAARPIVVDRAERIDRDSLRARPGGADLGSARRLGSEGGAPRRSDTRDRKRPLPSPPPRGGGGRPRSPSAARRSLAASTATAADARRAALRAPAAAAVSVRFAAPATGAGRDDAAHPAASGDRGFGDERRDGAGHIACRDHERLSELIARSQWQEALQLLQTLLRLEPTRRSHLAQVAYVRAREAMQLGNVSDARRELARALAIEPELQAARLALAELDRSRR
jgi:curved DNA-binding protein CbpA